MKVLLGHCIADQSCKIKVCKESSQASSLLIKQDLSIGNLKLCKRLCKSAGRIVKNLQQAKPSTEGFRVQANFMST